MNKTINPNFFNRAEEKGPFTYFSNLLLGKGHNSICFYAIDIISGNVVALKFGLNEKKDMDYKEEGILLNKLSDVNFYPKLYNFNSDGYKV